MSIEPVGVKDVIQAMLNLTLQRAELASSNIAGSTTPGFKAQRLDDRSFMASLRQAVAEPASCGNACVNELAPSVEEALQPPSLDAAVADLVAANSDYQALLQALNGHLGLMRIAVSGRSPA